MHQFKLSNKNSENIIPKINIKYECSVLTKNGPCNSNQCNINKQWVSAGLTIIQMAKQQEHITIAARVLLCASSHRQDDTYHSLCHTMSTRGYQRRFSALPCSLCRLRALQPCGGLSSLIHIQMTAHVGQEGIGVSI